jgi:hypothetical protein
VGEETALVVAEPLGDAGSVELGEGTVEGDGVGVADAEAAGANEVVVLGVGDAVGVGVTELEFAAGGDTFASAAEPVGDEVSEAVRVGEMLVVADTFAAAGEPVGDDVSEAVLVGEMLAVADRLTVGVAVVVGVALSVVDEVGVGEAEGEESAAEGPEQRRARDLGLADPRADEEVALRLLARDAVGESGMELVEDGIEYGGHWQPVEAHAKLGRKLGELSEAAAGSEVGGGVGLPVAVPDVGEALGQGQGHEVQVLHLGRVGPVVVEHVDRGARV